ncbi:MAG: VacJ family lipoprotein [Gammaproteobacteria bacterium]|nr:VacJ family lipoprotein [Gammaproteobacteria bacterium]
MNKKQNQGWPMRRLKKLAMVCGCMLLTGCASMDEFSDPRDPLEGFNRAIYSFNDALDRAVVKPVAKGYKAVLPVPVKNGVTNFFGNLSDVGSAVNNLLQFKMQRAGSDVARVAFNSTIGILGVMDVASNMDFPKYREDLGQTLGYWGVGQGPYLVLPAFGPSSVRDGIGWVGGWYLDPIFYVDEPAVFWTLGILRNVDKRANLLAASDLLEQAALDPYEFVKDAYLQKRRNEVHDGNPPLDPEWDEDFNIDDLDPNETETDSNE